MLPNAFKTTVVTICRYEVGGSLRVSFFVLPCTDERKNGLRSGELAGRLCMYFFCRARWIEKFRSSSPATSLLLSSSVQKVTSSPLIFPTFAPSDLLHKGAFTYEYINAVVLRIVIGPLDLKQFLP